MHLTLREQERLMIFVAADVARRRKARLGEGPRRPSKAGFLPVARSVVRPLYAGSVACLSG